MVDYVLDENIIVFAAKLVDKTDKFDDTCLWILTEISHRRDVVHCSKDLYQKYLSKISSLGKINQSAFLVQKLLENMKAAGRLKIYNEYPPGLPVEKGIPEDDVFIIRLVVWKRGVLLTADCRLRDRLNEGHLLKKYNLIIKKPHEFDAQ